MKCANSRCVMNLFYECTSMRFSECKSFKKIELKKKDKK